jgi:RHS repeat-associated protein
LPAAVAVTSHNAANQVLSFGDRGLTYDPNGNLLTQTDPTGTITYTWDARDRLSSLAGPAVTASFSYDALDRRVSRTVNGETMTFQYDGLDIVRESGPDGETGYLRTGALDEIVAQFAGPEMRVPMTDALGSTLAVLDAAGSPVTTYTYEPYGRVTTTNPTPRFPFRFTGREDDGTGLYYFRARYYDPVLSRFISEDPIGLLGGFNVYAYAGGDPVNWIDPLGLKMSRKTYVELCDFVRKYYTDAAEAGQNAPLPAEFILALSAHESKRGKSDAARDARGNFFGQTKPGGGLMTQGGFRNGADYFVKNWRNQYARGGQPPETIRDFVTNLTSDPSKMYNELGKDGQGDPEWREKVTDRYNEVVEVLKDPCCDPESQKGGP